jgi:hypothetical protein
MEILLKETQQVITENEFRNMHNNTSFPQILTEQVLDDFNAVAILEGPQATPSSIYEYSFRNGIQEINGKWFTKYNIGPVFTDNEFHTAEEQFNKYKYNIDTTSASNVRQTRNQLLKDSDWTQVKDVPIDQNAWATYRQELRDVTTQESFPYNIQWPVQPI